MSDASRGVDRRRPSPARMYDYYLGGQDNFPADRDAAEAVIAEHPQQPQLARNNRGFLHRAVQFVAEQGVRQFIDIGTGIPTSPNVHEIVHAVHPGARIVYIDNDPVVLAHDRALLGPDERITVVEGDVLDPHSIIADQDVQAAINFSEPVALLMVAVLHFARERSPVELIAPFRAHMSSGSYLVMSHGTTEGLSDAENDALERAYERTRAGARLRTREEIQAGFSGFEITEPGLIDVSRWRGFERTTHVQILAGVGYLP